MLVQIHDLFDLQKIADSGQCFRVAVFPDHTYRFISRNQILYIRRISDKDYEVNCTAEEWENIWIQYFDLERDYRALWNAIPEGDCFLKCAARVGEGIRVLRQDPWKTLITFILSQRKSIPAIRSSVELLSERYGTKVQTSREILHLFPTAWQMREASVEEYDAKRDTGRPIFMMQCIKFSKAGWIYSIFQASPTKSWFPRWKRCEVLVSRWPIVWHCSLTAAQRVFLWTHGSKKLSSRSTAEKIPLCNTGLARALCSNVSFIMHRATKQRQCWTGQVDTAATAGAPGAAVAGML